jgi:hypothetical protein
MRIRSVCCGVLEVTSFCLDDSSIFSIMGDVSRVDNHPNFVFFQNLFDIVNPAEINLIHEFGNIVQVTTWQKMKFFIKS